MDEQKVLMRKIRAENHLFAEQLIKKGRRHNAARKPPGSLDDVMESIMSRMEDDPAPMTREEIRASEDAVCRMTGLPRDAIKTGSDRFNEAIVGIGMLSLLLDAGLAGARRVDDDDE